LVLDRKAGVGWTTGNHTAQPVLTTCIGPGSELFAGFIDNTDISLKLKSLL
jgi:alkaline phosphatase